MDKLVLAASLSNANDPVEANAIISFAGAGTTNPISNGKRIKWTPEFLRKKVSTMVGMPVNVKLNADGKATGHTENFDIGTVKSAWYDEATDSGWANVTFWKHRYPKTVAQLQKLYANKEVDPSMEFLPTDMVTNEDGSVSPVDGRFSGIGFVGKGGDPRANVFLMAALNEDTESMQENKPVMDLFKDFVAFMKGRPKEEPLEASTDTLQAAHEGSFEWLQSEVRDHLQGEDPNNFAEIIATYSNYAIYKTNGDYFRIDYKRSGADLTFGEPQSVDPVYQPTAKASAAEGEDENTGQPDQGVDMTATPEELQAAKDQQLEELKASVEKLTEALAAQTALNEQLKAAREADEAEKKSKELADSRMAEIEKITPVKETLKASLYENLKMIDDTAYEAVKASFAAAAELKAGIAPEGDDIVNPSQPGKPEDPTKVDPKELEKWRAEAQAKFGTGPNSKDKE